MTKTLKDFLEVYKPKSPDEQKFVDKHVVIKHKDRNGNGDDVFNGNTKYIKRKEERKGYDVGDDEKVYEETEQLDEYGLVIPRRNNLVSLKQHSFGDSKLKGDQHKIDANKNGKVDAHDFHLLRKKKKVSEDIEEVDESYQELMALKNNIARNEKKMKAIPGIHPEKKRLAIQIEKDTKRHKELFSKHWSKNEEVDIDTVLDEALDLLMSIDEKTLTSAEMKKREEVVKAIKRENPKMDKSMAYAVATKTAKRVAEETEDLDESAKIAAHLIKRYGDNVRKSHVVSAANDFGVDASKLAKAVRSKLGKTTLAEEEDDGWYTHSQMHGSKKSERHPKGISAAEWKSGIRWHHGKNKRINIKEELEELDELSATTKDAYAQKAGKQLTGLFKKSGSDADAARKYYNRKNTVRKIANEEVEELDELSAKKLTDYTAAASDASKHKNLSTAKLDKRYGSMALAHEKVRARHAKVAAEGYMPTADEPTEANKKTAQKVRDMMSKEKKPVKEDTQIDELSATTMQRYKGAAEWDKDYETGTVDPKARVRREKGIAMATKKIAKEDVQIDELSKNAMLKYLSANKKSDKAAQEKGDYSKSDKRMRGTDVAVRKYTASPNSKYVRVPATEEVEHIDELSKKTLGSYVNKAAFKIGDQGITAGLKIQNNEPAGKNLKKMGNRQKGIERAVGKLTKEDIINRTIEKYVPEDLKFTPEERLLKRLDGLSETHVTAILGLFEDLNKDNQNKMIETVETREGINQILNFVLENRGK
jgi:hypothetical protein